MKRVLVNSGARLALPAMLALAGALVFVLAVASSPVSALRAPSVPRTSAAPPDFLLKWGTAGTGKGQFREPAGIAIDSDGDVYVTDQGNNRVQKFDSNGVYLDQWGTLGDGPGQFHGPCGIAYYRGDWANLKDYLYVVDSYNCRVEKFTTDGEFIAAFGSQGQGKGQFLGPEGIAVGPAGDVYVAESTLHRIEVFSPSGVPTAEFSSRGPGEGGYSTPHDVAVDSASSVYVTVPGSPSHGQPSEVNVFSRTGDWVSRWSDFGGGDVTPGVWGITIDGLANVYVTGWSAGRGVMELTSAGAPLRQWSLAVSGDPFPAQPGGIAVAANGDIYVADNTNSCVKKYGTVAPSSDKVPPETTVSGVDKQWHNRPVKLSFTATDNAGGSGVAYTEAHLQDWLLPIWEPWARVEGGVFVVPASAEHADDGDRLLEYRSVDKAGIVEAAKQVTVLIDTRAPNVKVQPATATRNRRVVVKFRAQDQLSPDLRFEGSVFRESEDPAASTASVHYASSAWLPRKKLHTWSFTCRLEPGKYSVYVWARDRAGNEGMGKAALAVTND